MSAQHEPPFAYLPFALPGLLVGFGLILGCGYGVLTRLDDSFSPKAGPGHTTIRGTIEWAGWRQSAAADGPARFLQVRLEGDPRGFLVSTSDLTAAFRERQVASEQAKRNRLPGLEGKQAVIVVDDHFQERPRPSTPYMKALRINGRTVVPMAPPGSTSGNPGLLTVLLLGGGLLLGIGLTSVSLHHIAVCVRHMRGS